MYKRCRMFDKIYAVTKNLIESTIRNCVTEQLDKIEHTGIINNMKLMKIETPLRTQSAVTEQIVKSQEEAAEETQQSLPEMKKEVMKRDVKKVIDAKMAKQPVEAVQPTRVVKCYINL